MKSAGGFGLIELLLALVIGLGVTYFALKSRAHTKDVYTDQMRAAGVKTPGAGEADTVKAVQKDLDEANRRHEKDLEDSLDPGR